MTRSDRIMGFVLAVLIAIFGALLIVHELAGAP